MTSLGNFTERYENTQKLYDVELTRDITVRGQYEGFHSWPDAPEEVAFLRQSHRHIFKYQITIDVFHDDRELEFFLVKKAVESKILPFMQLGDLGSCEMQAEFILRGLVNLYGGQRYYSVTISEDGENDGSIRWNPYR